MSIFKEIKSKDKEETAWTWLGSTCLKDRKSSMKSSRGAPCSRLKNQLLWSNQIVITWKTEGLSSEKLRIKFSLSAILRKISMKHAQPPNFWRPSTNLCPLNASPNDNTRPVSSKKTNTKRQPRPLSGRKQQKMSQLDDPRFSCISINCRATLLLRS